MPAASVATPAGMVALRTAPGVGFVTLNVNVVRLAAAAKPATVPLDSATSSPANVPCLRGSSK